MRRLVLLFATASMVLGACSSADGGASTTVSDATTSTTAPAGDEGSESAERLLVSSVGGSIRIVDEGGTPVAEVDAGSGTSYRQPVWSPDGSIVAAYTSVDDGHGLEAFDPATGERRWRAPTATPPFYFLPAPPGAPEATTSLRNAADGSGLVAEVIDRVGGVDLLAAASPFYTSWSPDGSGLAIHREGRIVEVRTGGVVEPLAEPTGAFQAPVWTDDGLVLLRTVGEDQILSVWDGATFRDIATVEGPARFSAASGLVAIQTIADEPSGGVQASVAAQSVPALPGGRLLVVDLATGATSTVSNRLTPMFQWDPSGTRLLFASFESEDSLEFRWNIWEDGQVTEGPSWEAQPVWFRDVVPFFDQYVQSISLWSSDGTAYAYPEIVDARPVVTIRTLGRDEAATIDDATWVTWRTTGP